MATTNSFQRDRLQLELDRGQRQNPRYSLRALAQRIQIHPGTLSCVLRGQRNLPRTQLKKVADRLELTGLERKFFLQGSSASADSNEADQTTIQHKVIELQLHRRIVSDWEYAAVLSLFDLSQPDLRKATIAKKLSLPVTRVQEILEDLLKADLIRKHSEKLYIKTDRNLSTTDDIPAIALIEAHLQELELAKQKLSEVPVQKRQYSSMTVAMAPENLPKAKELTRRFMMELGDLLEKGNRKEVYQICLQIFPLTETENAQ